MFSATGATASLSPLLTASCRRDAEGARPPAGEALHVLIGRGRAGGSFGAVDDRRMMGERFGWAAHRPAPSGVRIAHPPAREGRMGAGC
jgi:hypothetical protein